MLRKQGWLSIVFQHWKISYFEAILSGAAEGGAELRAAVSQVGDPIWSMHKKKGNQSVLAGELILTFCKTEHATKTFTRGTFDVMSAVRQTLANAPDVICGERLFNDIVVEAWRHGAIGALDISKEDFSDAIQREGWHYDAKRHHWTRNRDTSAVLWE